jgi:patatin-like phospholipase
MSQNLPPESDFPLTLAEVLSAELTEQRPDEAGPVAEQVSAALKNASTWTERQKVSDDLVPNIYATIRGLRENRSALCLSGGGIRSAIFNLGVLQGLARCGLLEKLDYLSTVSGGGYIASWLTRWIHRESADKVIDELKKPPKSPLEPEPKPIYNLRVFSNFLTPKTGALSPDTWTMIATYLRNLFLNWLVFVPAIMTFLMLPRLWNSMWIGATNYGRATQGGHLPLTLGLLGLGFGLVSLMGITLNLPTAFNLNWSVKTILLTCVLPLLLMAACFSLYWVMVRDIKTLDHPTDWLHTILCKRPGWQVFAIAGAAIPALPQVALSAASLVKLIRRFFNKDKELNWQNLVGQISSCLLVPALVAAGGALTGVLTYAILNVQLVLRISNAIRFESVSLNPDLLYVSLSVPFLLCIFMIGGTFVAGFSSRFSFSEDQEWWARCGSWTLMIVLAWGGLTLLVTFSPLLLVDFRSLIHGHTGSIKSTVTSIAGLVSGAISLVGGFSSSTKGNGKEEGASTSTRVFSIITSLAAAIFALYLAIVLIWASDWFLFGLAKTLATVRPLIEGVIGRQFRDAIAPADHQAFVLACPWWLEVLGTAVLFFATVAMGWCINTNRFSLHYWWRNRMMRSMLGTTRVETERDSSRTKFTDFDNEDNVAMNKLTQGKGLAMHELTQKPFHVLNVTLNLVGGDKLEWQDRKAESFTMSPLHCGSYWLGYRNSTEYGGQNGISLATAASISGAAASPNMGYMMTSSVVRIIMTLFNVRLGFWLGNPGPAGERTYKLDSPRESVRPIVEEALGLTDDKRPYVYLSDGGHFENLGLYEMVLRRCRFIVVCDAGTDPGYEFGDLAMAIRQIRVDFGVPIDMSEMIFGRDPEKTGNRYCALGVIRYSCVDGPEGSTNPKDDAKYDGLLIYIKPSLNGDEPRDVLNYHETSKTFPQESAADQWFSEAQFESYRALGSHMIETIRDALTNARKHVVDTDNTGQRPTAQPADTEKETKQSESKAAFARVAPELGDRIDEVIKALKTSNDVAPGCGEYTGFAARARAHVRRHSQ